MDDSKVLKSYNKLKIVDDLANKIENINILLEKQHQLRSSLKSINGTQSNYSLSGFNRSPAQTLNNPISSEEDQDLDSEEIEYCSLRDSDSKLLQQTRLADKQIAILKKQIEKIERQKKQYQKSQDGYGEFKSNAANEPSHNEFSRILNRQNSDFENPKSQYQQSHRVNNSIAQYSKVQPDNLSTRKQGHQTDGTVRIKEILDSEKLNSNLLHQK